MKKGLQIGIYAIFYLVLPMYFFYTAEEKYPDTVTWNLITVSMIYLATLFILSTIQIFVKWRSVPSAGMFLVTVLYMNTVMRDITINYYGAVVQINLKNFLLILYMFLMLKTLAVAYDDIKGKKVTQGSAGYHRGSRSLQR